MKNMKIFREIDFDLVLLRLLSKKPIFYSLISIFIMNFFHVLPTVNFKIDETFVTNFAFVLYFFSMAIAQMGNQVNKLPTNQITNFTLKM